MRRWMQVGMGVLGWPPSEFWGATMFDLCAAVEGYLEKNGAETAGDEAGLDMHDLAELRRKVNAGEGWR